MEERKNWKLVKLYKSQDENWLNCIKGKLENWLNCRKDKVENW